jgi:transcription-repair coupling factor (superfamily II helicase)
MLNFYEGRTQVLLTTSIIESGLDVTNANTLIVDRADTFGLGQLYQMRGRVGRGPQRAYAYFLIPDKVPISKDAEERLAVLESYQELGSGFHIASHDLEIRGSGELLGREQSGQIAAIGFDAYVQLLQESVAEIKGSSLERPLDPDINLGIDTTLPEAYIPEIGIRLMFYRKLAAAADEAEVDSFEKEMDDRFGTLPASVQNLVSVMRIKCQLRRLGVKTLTAGKNGFSLIFDASTPINPLKLVESVKKYPNHFQMSPEGKLFLRRPEAGNSAGDVLRGVEGALAQLESWIG